MSLEPASISAEVVYDHDRLCGTRKPGGYYFVTPPGSFDCALMPGVIHGCKFCGATFRFSRAWQWVTLGRLLQWVTWSQEICDDHRCGNVVHCFAHEPIDQSIALVWIGQKHYTAESWLAEARKLGISRRLHVPPRDFEPGKTLVFFAHKEVATLTRTSEPAILAVARPRIQYIVRPTDDEEKLKRLRLRNIDPVIVRSRQVELFDDQKVPT